GDFLDGAASVRRPDMEPIFAGLIGKVSKPLTVWRPGRIPLPNTWGPRQVAGFAGCDIDDQNIALSLEGGAISIGRKPGFAQVSADWGKMRAQLGEVVLDLHHYFFRFARIQMIQVQSAELFIHNGAGTGRGGCNIESLVLEHLRHALRG